MGQATHSTRNKGFGFVKTIFNIVCFDTNVTNFEPYSESTVATIYLVIILIPL